MKATGVNNHTKKRLKELMAEGYNPGEISSMIQVEEKSVENWMRHFAPELFPVDDEMITMDNSKDEIVAFAVANNIEIDETDTKEVLIETIDAALND